MNYIVAVPLNRKIAEFIGKKGSENGITFYNRKIDNNVVVALVPTNIEEKFHGFAESMLIADQIVISTEQVDKGLGEALVCASLLDKRTIVLNENDISNLLTGISIKELEFSSKEELLNKITSRKNGTEGLPVRVDIDHAFPVKGIGTVALGIVTKGVVNVHDLLSTSYGKQVSVKSIQSQDVDIEAAGPGTRVGLALKGIDPAEINKGEILSTKAVGMARKVVSRLKFSSFAKEELSESKSYLFASGFSHADAKLKNEDGKYTIELMKPVPIEKGDRFLLIRERSPRAFASGTAEEVSG